MNGRVTTARGANSDARPTAYQPEGYGGSGRSATGGP